MAKTQNTVYEIVSDMATRQDALDERITGLEEKIQNIRVNDSKIKSTWILIKILITGSDWSSSRNTDTLFGSTSRTYRST